MFCLVHGVHRKVVEGRGVGSRGCVVHVHVYGESYVVDSLVATEHADMVCLEHM